MKLKMAAHWLAAFVLVLSGVGGAAVHAQSGAACAGGAAAVTPGLSQQALVSDGETRTYLRYVPVGYDPSKPTPLVISLHGFAGNPAEQARDSGWNEIADRENFIVLYPAGTGTPLRWNTGQTDLAAEQRAQFRGPLAQFLSGFFETDRVDDVSFVRNLIMQVSEDLCVDASRVYVNGMSNGGGMTNRLACEAADVFAAAGMVAGAYTDFPGGCHPARPVPVVAFHGVADPIVPYEGNERIHFPAIETWVQDWAQRDSCAPTPEAIPDAHGDVTGTRYTSCAGGAEVDFYSISDGGHTWPGGAMGLQFLLGKTSRDIDASETMWAFFAAHPMPQ